MGGRWVFSPASCFIEKDHYELCLAQINWIAASQVDAVSHAAFTVHLGNNNNQCGLLLLCLVHISGGLYFIYPFLLSVACISQNVSPSRPDTGHHSSLLPSHFILISLLSTHLHLLCPASIFSPAVFPHLALRHLPSNLPRAQARL